MGADTDPAGLESVAMSHRRAADTEVRRLAHPEVEIVDWEEIAAG